MGLYYQSPNSHEHVKRFNTVDQLERAFGIQIDEPDIRENRVYQDKGMKPQLRDHQRKIDKINLNKLMGNRFLQFGAIFGLVYCFTS